MSLCRQWGECFARVNWQCELLTRPIDPAKKRCPFQKPDREVTNGKRYPLHKFYTKEGEI